MKKGTAKTFAVGVFAGIALMSAAGFSYAALTKIDVSMKPTTFVMNGQEIKPSDKEQQYFNGMNYVPASFIHQDTTYVPLRFISEKLGLHVGYNAANQTISLGEKKVAEKPLKFEVAYPSPGTAPAVSPRIQGWFDDHKKQKFADSIWDTDSIYVGIAAGAKPNGGYSVQVVGVVERGNDVVVKVKYNEPEPGRMYTQVITYPATLIKIPITNKKITFETVTN
ncbi:protease complex subunit PrcB family protein [Aneurinibacillus sp. REN35]|uniref:protease complex subunit PrcB family protein n=1 Tax=Aneurinibacillus sp. REN35 TaxID=3237286 RepID=UPI0035293D26